MNGFLDETEAVNAFKTGNIEAFNYIYHKYHQQIFANILKVIHDDQIAKDILQEVFITFWEKRDIIKENATVGSWLFVVSFNKATDFLRQSIKSNFLEINEPVENLLVAESENIDLEKRFHQQISMLNDAVNKLPQRKREVFTLSRYEGKSHDEIATTLGISVQSVKDYLKQSTALIKSYISNHKPSGELAMLIFILSL